MPRPPRPLMTAFLAILLAILLPAVVVMFGTIRSRQLQSTANPRWAKFARGTTSVSSNMTPPITPRRTRIVEAGSASPRPTITVPEIARQTESAFTGSVTGRRTVEASIPTQLVSTDVSNSVRSHSASELEETPPIIFRPVDEDPAESPTTQMISRLESQLKDVRQRLDHLSTQQQEQQVEESLREEHLLQVLKKLNELAWKEDISPEPAFSTEPTPPLTSTDPLIVPPAPSSAADEPSDSEESLSKRIPVAEIPAPLPTSLPEPEESAIRIRRSAGNTNSETFSIDIQDADIRQVFSQLSEAAEISIVPSPEVQGRVSLNLHDVRIEAALNAILKSRNYVIEREEGIVIVRTAEEAERRKHQNRQLVLKVYRPSYLSAAELNQLIEPLLSNDGRHSISSPYPTGLSPSHDNSSDQRETVIVQDMPEVLQQIDQILVDVDVPPLQVSIEAKILRVRLSEGMTHGLDLGQLPCQRDSGASFAEGGLKHARLSCNVPTFIKSMERLADTSLVTSQRIQVLNRHRAEMLIGDRIGYQSHAGGDIRFTESGTRLIMRPSVSADGFIRIDIQPEHSTSTTSRRKGVPSQNTAELTTQVLIRDGATVAIAGLIAEQATETTKRMPIVSAIPIVGAPFRQRKESLQRTELIVLVTPRLVIDGESESEGQCLEQATEERAAEFRDQQNRVSRHNQARAHFDRARCLMEQQNYVKARQQIDASLRLNKADLQALRLRNEINQSLMR